MDKPGSTNRAVALHTGCRYFAHNQAWLLLKIKHIKKIIFKEKKKKIKVKVKENQVRNDNVNQLEHQVVHAVDREE